MAMIIKFLHKEKGIDQKRSWKNDTKGLSLIKIEIKYEMQIKGLSCDIYLIMLNSLHG